MSFLRRVSTARLLAVCATVVAAAILVATAVAALAPSASPPPAKPLAVAVHDALAAPETTGLTARIRFVNHLADLPHVEGVGGPSPILTGARGRLWLGSNGRARLELQSDSGDAQVVSDGRNVLVYDSSSKTAYRAALPQQRDKQDSTARANEAPPSLADIRDAITRLRDHGSIAGPTPGTTAGRPSYTVRVGPHDKAGLIGAAELAWDAVRGVPLRVAVYARGSSTPVLELEATDISYGSVADSVFTLRPPVGSHVVNLTRHEAPSTSTSTSTRAHTRKTLTPLAGLAAARKAVAFSLSAPKTLAGRTLDQVRTVDWSGSPATLLVYGHDLGALVVIERAADRAKHAAGGHDGGLGLPSLSIGGVRADELATPLGTVVRFERGGVSYMVLGSVPSATVVDAARAL